MAAKRAFGTTTAMGLLLLLALSAGAPLQAETLSVNSGELEGELRALIIEKLATNVSQATESELRSATYFDDLLREFAPVGLDTASFTQEAVGLHRELLEARAKDAEEGTNANVRGMIQQRLGQAIVASLDSGSQEIVGDLQGLLAEASEKLKALDDVAAKVAEDPSTDVVDALRQAGLSGDLIDDLEFLEGGYQAAMEKYGHYGDYFDIFMTLKDGLSARNPGAKLDALFKLAADHGGKIPVLGKFIELYAKVAQEMIGAVGRLGDMLRARQGYCLGVGTTGHIPSRFVDEPNRVFSAAYPNVEMACPAAKAGIYRNVYVDTGNARGLYFWTGSSFIAGNPAHAGLDDVRALIRWLRGRGETGRAGDIGFIANAYNVPPGFTARETAARTLAQSIAREVRALADDLVTCDKEERQRVLIEDGGLAAVLIGLGQDTDGIEYFPYVDDVVDKVIEEAILEGEDLFQSDCKAAQSRLQGLRVATISGRVIDGAGAGLDGISVELDSKEGLLDKCSELVTQRGAFEAVYLTRRGQGLAVTISARDEDRGEDEERVSVAAGEKQASCTLTLGEGSEPASLSLTPAERELVVGQSLTFDVRVLDAAGQPLIVPDGQIGFSGAPGGTFVAKEEGTFTVTATYQGLSDSAVVTVTAEPQECQENETPNEQTGACECLPPFVEDEQGRCVDVATLTDGVAGEEGDICSADVASSSFATVTDLAAEIRTGVGAIDAFATKFQKEVNDRAAEVCTNNLAAYCYYSANEELTAVTDALARIETLSNDIVMSLGLCPDLAGQMASQGQTLSGLIQTIGGLGAEVTAARGKLDDMKSRLDQAGCDETEVADAGQSVMPPGADPDFIQSGGNMGEVPGDGIDNDADGLQDEAVEGLAGFNVTLVLFDSGSAKDDAFGLSVSGYGNLGQTPAGGLRSYGLNLPPGSYTATVTVIVAPDDRGTFTLVVLQNGESIGSLTDSPAQGAAITLPFTVTE